jgi:hypothetical protein
MAIDVSGANPTFVTVVSDTVTTNTTFNANPPFDREYVFADEIVAMVNTGVLVSGFGLRLETTVAVGGADLRMTNNGGIAIDQATPALQLAGNVGALIYSGTGFITNDDGNALSMISSGAGSVIATILGQIHAGDTGVTAIANGPGGIAISATGGQIGTAAQRVGLFGIAAGINGTFGQLAIDAGDIFTDGEHGILAQINNAAATGDVTVTANGTVDSLLATGISVGNSGSGSTTVIVNGTVSGVNGVRGGGNATTVLNSGTIIGTGGTAVVFFGGNDTYDGSGGTVIGTVFGDAGSDTFLSGAGNETFDGGTGVDTVSYIAATGPVIVALAAGAATGHGSDTLLNIENARGGAFADTFIGNGSANVFSGGGGDDTFVVAPGGGADRVLGFVAGFVNPDDRIDARAFADISSLDAFLALSAQVAADTVVNFGGGDTLTLSNVTLTNLVDRDLILVPQLGDVLWRHDDGQARTRDHDLGNVTGLFEIAATGDFDHDGDADILWRHPEGQTVAWELQGGQLQAVHNFGVVSTGFQIAGTGDFDTDGDDDILWRGNAGQVVIWELQDGAYVVNHNQPVVPTTWQIAGTGDFDNDGDADILWRHNQGQSVIWELEDGNFVTNHNLPAVPTTWQIAGTGDFDADGDADIVWRHDEGAVAVWEIEDAAFVVNHNQPHVPTTWHIQGTQDFDHDGDDDILWRHDDGQVVTWAMQDGNLLRTESFGAAATTWQIAGTGAFEL